jgi:hypothetical protein
MVHFRGAAVAAAVLIGALCSGSSFAAPISAGGVATTSVNVELAQWHPSRQRHIGPRPGRCWWENRRVRDHRGRWVLRRVHVCRR